MRARLPGFYKWEGLVSGLGRYVCGSTLTLGCSLTLPSRLGFHRHNTQLTALALAAVFTASPPFSFFCGCLSPVTELDRQDAL